MSTHALLSLCLHVCVVLYIPCSFVYHLALGLWGEHPVSTIQDPERAAMYSMLTFNACSCALLYCSACYVIEIHRTGFHDIRCILKMYYLLCGELEIPIGINPNCVCRVWPNITRLTRDPASAWFVHSANLLWFLVPIWHCMWQE